MKSKVVLLSIIVFIAFSVTFGEQTVSVRIKSGLIDGKREVFDDRDLDVFLGIPYAQPPVGELRFKKPLPLEQWSETLDATQWPNSCLQNKMQNEFFNQNTSEDCLYLNIWSPKDKTSEETLKPVLFWIHGGALTAGSSVEKFYSGGILWSCFGCKGGYCGCHYQLQVRKVSCAMFSYKMVN